MPTIERLYEAYQKVSTKQERTSVPIDAVIKEAGLWQSAEARESASQALLESRFLLQLDEGDWPSADVDTKAVHLTDPMRTENRHGYLELRKLTMMAFVEAPCQRASGELSKKAEELLLAKLAAGNDIYYARDLCRADLENEGYRTAEIDEAVNRVLDRVGIPDESEMEPEGERQRHCFEIHPEHGCHILTDNGQLLKRFAHQGEAEAMCQRLQAFYAAELEGKMDAIEMRGGLGYDGGD
jgi:hypothetical protein